MRLVIQRVSRASVLVAGQTIASIGFGLAILAGVSRRDGPSAADRLADKVAKLRIFNDQNGKMNLSAYDVGAEILVVSQFTLYADMRRGRRPSFIDAAAPSLGRDLYLQFVEKLQVLGFHVATGSFGTEMLVSIQNDGPVTIVMDSEDLT